MDKIGVRLLLLVAVVAGAFAWWEHHQAGKAQQAKDQAELQAGIDASRVLTDRFAAESDLRVARRSGTIRTRGACTSLHLFSNEQRTIAPYSVGYFVDLAGMDRSRYRWDARDRVMFVEVPDVTVDAPNIDTAHARSEQSGMVISRACGLAMQQQVAGRLRDVANDWARRPDHLAEARGAARAAVAALVRGPLAAAGLGKVTVRVRLAGDPRPADDRQWDVSRSIEEVLADPRLRP